MGIREHLSVYLESGYLFDDMSGKLKWFEIDKILISFTYGVVRTDRDVEVWQDSGIISTLLFGG